MKKHMIFILLLIFASSLLADFSYQQERGNLVVSYQNNDLAPQDITVETVLAIPATAVEVEIISSNYAIFDADDNFIGNETERNQASVKITDSFVMRELYAHTVELNLQPERAEGRAVLTSLEFSVNPTKRVEIPQKVSPAFLPVYRSVTGNFAESYLYMTEIAPTRMLIIAKENLFNTMQTFIDWKQASAIETDIFSITEAGGSSENIRAFIADRYNNLETRPDYLLLVGDVNGSFELPSFYISDANNVTDLPFTMIEGDDYFPEILAGRFSIDSEMELMTIINKVIFYEKTPYMEDSSWLESATLVAGNYSDSPPMPTTPVNTSKWLEEKLDYYGYANVDEFYYPPLYPGSTDIINSINSGVNLITYRGWGNANGWHYPEFKRQHIDELNNGYMLPVVTSFVCNTGDFANQAVDPSFGEKFVRAGTPSIPKGAVIFVGPSDLHTNTRYNNSLFSGFYHGFLDEDNFIFSTALLRSKYELYDNFPRERAVGQEEAVEFYFHVYNILGDPSLMMRSRVPNALVAEFVSEINTGTNYLDIVAAEADGALVSAVKDGEIIARGTMENGAITLYFEPQEPGQIEVTLTKPNHIPYIQTVEVSSHSVDLGISSVQSSEVIAGAEVTIDLELTNFGSETASAVAADLISNNEMVTIESGTADFGDIAANASANASFVVTIAPESPNGESLAFSLEISDGSIAKFALLNNSILFEITELEIPEDGVLDPGDDLIVNLTVKNIGSIDVENLTAIPSEMSDAILVSDTVLEFGDLLVGETATAELGISVAADAFVGRLVSINLDFVDAEEQTTSAIYTTQIGTVQSSDPTGPDNYGYYAYDNTDVGYEEAPEYEWHVVDPEDGGNGTIIPLADDQTEVVDLPFTFQYYGEAHDLISVSSNGWLAFDETDVDDFTNWNIPAALGPYAMVAPYWDDLIGIPFDDGSGMHYHIRLGYDYFPEEGKFVIQWNGAVNRHNDSSIEKFEVVLYDPAMHQTATGDGIIQFNYHTVDNPDEDDNYSTVGIENGHQTDGICYSYSDFYAASAVPLSAGLAIKFTTNSPDDYVGTDENEMIQPQLQLLGNYPNPFNPTTTISFSTSQAEQYTELQIYNTKGQKVKTLVAETLPAGTHSVVWAGDDHQGNVVSSGVYFYQLSDGKSNISSGKCLLLK
ncbi:MAG: C25 family cysteine peptidase [Candidatus Cloacimonadales bacterium]